MEKFRWGTLQREVTLKGLSKKKLAQVNFQYRSQALQQKNKENKRILPFVTQYHPSVPNLKEILMSKWHLIEQQPKLRETF